MAANLRTDQPFMDRFHETGVISCSHGSWRDCIEKKCGLVLSSDFIRQRSASRNSKANEKRTLRFRKLCGDTHWVRVCEWFSRAERKLSNK
jgi:hypothetical protein